MKRMIVLLFCLGLILFSGCMLGDVHYSIKDIKQEGWEGDYVDINVARISRYGGGVGYSPENNNYAFFVYDKSLIEKERPYHIPVVVSRRNIDFEPKEGDFINIERGELVESKVDLTAFKQENWKYKKETGEQLIIMGRSVVRSERPTGW